MSQPFIVDTQIRGGYTDTVQNLKSAGEGVTQGENYDKG